MRFPKAVLFDLDDTLITHNEALEHRQLGVDRHFEVVVTSEEAGVGKPAPLIFHLACQKMGVEPADAAYVGDLLETDALGAENAGMNGIWLNRENARDDRSSQVRTITSLARLSILFV